jgi:hypothetical protein
MRSREIVAGGRAELEELGCHHRAHTVNTDILAADVAAPVAEETRHRIERARFELVTEHVP